MSYSPDRIKQLNDERLKPICPVVAEKIRKLIELAAADGFTLMVTQGIRTYDEQNALYAKGRTAKGSIVTHARAGESWHNFALAVDFGFVVNSEIDWTDTLYQRIGKWADAVGLEWGGRWKTIKDLPHVQQINGMSTAAARALYAKGGLAAVWAKIGNASEKPNSSTVPAGKSSTITTVFEELKKGVVNVGAVKSIQRMLVFLGYLRDTDGVFGKFTESAVRAFQGEYGLRQDGILGKLTAEKLTEVFNSKKK